MKESNIIEFPADKWNEKTYSKIPIKEFIKNPDDDERPVRKKRTLKERIVVFLIKYLICVIIGVLTILVCYYLKL